MGCNIWAANLKFHLKIKNGSGHSQRCNSGMVSERWVAIKEKKTPGKDKTERPTDRPEKTISQKGHNAGTTVADNILGILFLSCGRFWSAPGQAIQQDNSCTDNQIENSCCISRF